jgi:hypothetical protein
LLFLCYHFSNCYLVKLNQIIFWLYAMVLFFCSVFVTIYRSWWWVWRYTVWVIAVLYAFCVFRVRISVELHPKLINLTILIFFPLFCSVFLCCSFFPFLSLVLVICLFFLVPNTVMCSEILQFAIFFLIDRFLPVCWFSLMFIFSVMADVIAGFWRDVWVIVKNGNIRTIDE